MGQRANLILIDSLGQHLYYCHWCANVLPTDIFWGPTYTVHYILSQVPTDENKLLDEVWAEGGIVVDTERQVLLFFGGEDLLFDIPLRRLYLDLLREVWAGWTVRWAHDGIFDIADYVGIPRERFVNNDSIPPESVNLAPPEENDWINSVGSVLFENGSLRLFPLRWELEPILTFGSQFINVARQSPGVEMLRLDQWPLDSFPDKGFHIDVSQKQLSWWAAHEPGIIGRVKNAWLGWSCEWWQDNFEFHLAQTQQRLTLPVRSDEDLLTTLETILMFETRSCGPDLVLKSVEQDIQQGHDVKINPYALRQDPQNVPLMTKRQIFDAAVRSWRQKRSASNL